MPMVDSRRPRVCDSGPMDGPHRAGVEGHLGLHTRWEQQRTECVISGTFSSDGLHERRFSVSRVSVAPSESEALGVLAREPYGDSPLAELHTPWAVARASRHAGYPVTCTHGRSLVHFG